jgi:DNA-binding NarL/FixJ family response regulator
MQSLKLLVVADDPLARAGLATLLANHQYCDVVAQSSGVDLLEDAQDDDEFTANLDVIVWDLGWDFAGETPAWDVVDLPIVALVPVEGETAVFIPTPISILTRSSDADQIMAAAQAAARGLVTFDPAISFLSNTPTHQPDFTPIEELTPREIEVIQLIAEGMTNKAIAQQLHISSHTVKFHVNALMNKLSAQSRTAAVVRATRMGLISL